MCIGAAMSFFVGEIHYSLESPADRAVNLVKGWIRREDDMPGYRLQDHGRVATTGEYWPL